MKSMISGISSKIVESNKAKFFLLGTRILWIITTIIYIVLFYFITNKYVSLSEDDIDEYNIKGNEEELLKDDKIFNNYYKSYNKINAICGTFLILLCIVNIISSFYSKLNRGYMLYYKRMIGFVSLHLQLLFIAIMFLQNHENELFFCNINKYIYWFEDYDNKTDLFINSGENLCKVHNYSYIFPACFLFFSLIEFVVLYFKIEKHFRKKFLIFYIKMGTGIMYLALFYIFLKSKSFYNNILSEYNIFTLDDYSDPIKIIIFATQKQKMYYFQLLLVSTVSSAIVFCLLGYFDIYTIMKSCRFSLLVNIPISVFTMIVVFSQLLFSSYILETSAFFCAYEEFIEIHKRDQKASNKMIAPSNITETDWFCNLKSFDYIYFTNISTCLVIFGSDFIVSLYLVFSKKYAPKTS